MDKCGLINDLDEMGRVELPREFRKLLELKEGNKVELGLDNGKITISKYKPMEKLNQWACHIIEAISTVVEHNLILSDDKKVLYSNKKKFFKKTLSNEAQEIIFKRETIIKKSESSNMINMFLDFESDFCCELIVPITKDNDVLGAIIVLAEENKCFDDDTIKVCKAFASFLSCVIS